LSLMPGGVNSPVRSFTAVGGTPIHIASASGAILETTDGRRLVDFCNSWGALLMGHAAPDVVRAVQESAARGLSYGISHPAEVTLAETIRRAIPSVERVRLVSSGTEAAMTAIRLARAWTDRDRIIKFEGCYHGHSDSLLVEAGSGVLTGGQASSAGVPRGLAEQTLVVPFNDAAAVRAALEARGGEVAAVIVEPIAANMGVVPPADGFLAELRHLTRRHGALLVFDEVITGFRLGWGGYQKLCGIEPDLTCLGKIIGGGMPLAAVGGRADIMEQLAPLGKVYQAGTLSGNPVAVAAGTSTLEALLRNPPYERLARMGDDLRRELSGLFCEHDAPLCVQGTGSMFTVFCAPGPVRNLSDARRSDTGCFARLHRFFLERGIYLPPSQFETCFLSAAHSREHVDLFLKAMEEFLEQDTKS